MTASDSKSNDRSRVRLWSRTWMLAVAIVVVVLAADELFWRMRGWKPTVEAARDTWVLARLRVRPRSTVLIGTSRLQSAVDPLVWAQTTGGPAPVMLAVEGEGPMPTLADLAEDSSFRGTVIAGMMPAQTFDSRASSETIGKLSEYIREYRLARVSPAKRWEAVLRTALPSQFVFRRTEVLPDHLVSTLLSGREPRKGQYALRRDQYRAMDFDAHDFPPNRPSILDSARFRFIRDRARPLTGAALESVIARLRAQVRAIQERGGSVTFVLLQGCGGQKEIEDQVFPKNLYWNRLAEIPGVTTFDSDDFPQIAELPCYDGSHIHAAFSPLVTRLLAEFVTGAPA